MSADEVYDTTFAADMTVMEETAEFLRRMEAGGPFPMFTSCCPAWIRYLEHDVDLVLTTQEVIQMIQEAGIRFGELQGEAPDMPFGLGTGAGVIFGTTGGVAEAVARRVMESESKNTLQAIAHSGLRGTDGIRAAELTVGDKTVRIGIVGLANAKRLIAKMEAGEEHFDLVEVMTCTTGCVGGVGQPIGRKEQKYARAKGLYEADRKTLIKSSQHNPILKTLYEKLPPEKAHELLHVHYPQPEKMI